MPTFSATMPALRMAVALTATLMAFVPATAQQSGAPPRILLDPAVTDTRSLPAAPPQPRSSMRSTGHALLDFRYQPYDPGAAASTAAHPAYEIAGTVAGGTYAFGHIGGRRVGH